MTTLPQIIPDVDYLPSSEAEELARYLLMVTAQHGRARAIVIKDNTLLPGEWYGGQLHLAAPTDQDGLKKDIRS
jgi:hypothetical protein